jgi:hypothetical protein
MNFGLALELLKNGKKLCREGWNGKGLFVYLVPAASYPAQTNHAKETFGDMVPYAAYFALVNKDGNGKQYVNTWVPAINDVLAEDWQEAA